MEIKTEMTPSEAMLDFEARYFKGMFKHKYGDRPAPGYHACVQAIISARAGTLTFSRAARILKKHAPPGAYEITQKIEVIAGPNGAAFRERLPEIQEIFKDSI